ncbi:uncharacterized protein SAPINGB_P004158 [Magnusiomyces paraingens]|uniref:RNA polymerase sigma factor 70 region 4 type 2 domain-containing protein n=1 Tax=Magnusiomyces paraingens TaxID=2606893 RepID=A0A5E8BT13_9ASCO|nr:uncharacterized protein SAPINGB_P004158 [Saprochaete ingens]VVT54603.1 unnamed protein product [Saprochaete ingens]
MSTADAINSSGSRQNSSEPSSIPVRHPSSVSTLEPQWLRNRKLTVLYYRSCGMPVADIAARVGIQASHVRRYLDEILASNSI